MIPPHSMTGVHEACRTGELIACGGPKHSLWLQVSNETRRRGNSGLIYEFFVNASQDEGISGAQLVTKILNMVY